MKYQFLKGTQNGAFDLGVSYFPPTEPMMSSVSVQDFGLYPMVLFSTAHYFYGVRVVYIRQVEDSRVYNYLMPGGIAGLSVGSRFRFLPGIGLYYSAPNSWTPKLALAFGLGFGLEYEFGKP